MLGLYFLLVVGLILVVFCICFFFFFFGCWYFSIMVAGGYGWLSLWNWVMVEEVVVNEFIVERREVLGL